MPLRIEPCLALSKQTPPRGDEWTYEVKWDGYRICVHLENGRVRILTRGGHDWTHRFPAIEDSVGQLGVGAAILDGEAVVLDERGRPDFGRLQQSLGGRLGKKSSDVATMMAFDLLYFDGHDIRSLELSARRYLLESLWRDEDGAVRLSEEINGDGNEILEAARKHGLEGIVAKNRDSTYTSGRTGDLDQGENDPERQFYHRRIRAVERRARRNRQSRLCRPQGAGSRLRRPVGTGFNEQNAEQLRRMLDRLKRKGASVDYTGRGKNLVWVKPTLIAEIEYRAWTHDGKLRAASYKGLRDVQDNAEIYEIES